MNNLYIDIYTEEGCNPDLVVECERMEIKASVILEWAKANGYALIPLDERRLERQADAAVESMVKLSKRIGDSDWYKAQEASE